MTIEILRQNIAIAIKQMKHDRTKAASINCIKQMTSARGVTIPPKEYHKVIDKLITEVASELKFPILKDN